MPQMIVSFNLDVTAHHALAEWLEALNDVRGRRTAEIVRVLAAHAAGAEVKPATDNAAILATLARIEAKLSGGFSITAPPIQMEQGVALPADVLANLDSLAD